jgi:hypothetical protein
MCWRGLPALIVIELRSARASGGGLFSIRQARDAATFNMPDARVLQGAEPSRIATILRRQSRTLQVSIDQVMGT